MRGIHARRTMASEPAKAETAPAPRWYEDPVRLAFAVALPAALLAVFQLGRLHPDEVFQHLEPALYRAFGYGVMAWEWQVGLRNWALPGILSWLLRFCAALGIDDPQGRRAVLELPQYGLHAAMLLSVYRFAARRVTPVQARWSMVLVGLYGPLMHFAGRTMGESFSTSFLVLALERFDCALEEPLAGARKWRVPAVGGLLLGCAVICRYGSAVIVAAAMLWLLLRLRWAAFAAASGGGLVAAGGLAWLDAETWGKPFHSFFKYVEFNVTSGQAAAQFGAEPFWYYLPWLGMLALWAWPGLVLSAKKGPRAWLFVFAGLAYAIAISLTKHKEARFLYPALVILCVAGAPAWVAWVSQRFEAKVDWRRGALGLSVALGACLALFRTPFAPERTQQFRLFLEAGRHATGVVLVNEGMWGSPGFFWLGKNIPWFPCDFANDPRFQQAMRTPQFNRMVTWDDRAVPEAEQFGFHVIEQQRRAKLLARDAPGQ